MSEYIEFYIFTILAKLVSSEWVIDYLQCLNYIYLLYYFTIVAKLVSSEWVNCIILQLKLVVVNE